MLIISYYKYCFTLVHTIRGILMKLALNIFYFGISPKTNRNGETKKSNSVGIM